MRSSDLKERTFFRSGDRIFCLNGQWFFQTREDDKGPFASREQAELELTRYVSEMSELLGMRGRLAGINATDLRLIED